MDVIGLSGMGGRGRGDENSPPIKYESIVAVSRFERGQLAEIRLHPLELTDDVRMAHRGIPRIASPQAAQRILTRLQKLSAPLGTTITIERQHRRHPPACVDHVRRTVGAPGRQVVESVRRRRRP